MKGKDENGEFGLNYCVHGKNLEIKFFRGLFPIFAATFKGLAKNF